MLSLVVNRYSSVTILFGVCFSFVVGIGAMLLVFSDRYLHTYNHKVFYVTVECQFTYVPTYLLK